MNKLIKELIEVYKFFNLVIYSCNLTINNKKKIIQPLKSNIDMNNFSYDYINIHYNGYLLKTGTILNDGNYLVGLDIDKKEDVIDNENEKLNVYNGMTKWEEILKDNNINDKLDIDTPIQKTGNDGLHYLFKVNKKDYSLLKTLNGLYIDNKKYTIDFKAKNQCLIVEPTKYYDNKVLKEYLWVKSPKDQEIKYMPLFVFDMLTNSKAPKKEKKTNLNIVLETNEEELLYINDLLNNLNPDRFDDGNNWRLMARLFNNLNLSIELFDEYSKTSKKYNIKYLQNLSIKDDLNNHKLICAKYTNLIQKMNISKINYDINYDIININDRYLIDNKTNYNIDQNDLTKKINLWMTNEKIKSLNIKSPYDTGKTQILKSIINYYNPKKILFVSYRKTLTYDVRAKFASLNFKSYLTEDLNSDRLIIQIESLHKLRNLDDTFISDDCDMIKNYDLIIIDEVESILNQFSSSTLRDVKKETFQLFDDLLFAADKIITLDGDMNIRTYDFIASFGQMINIVNNTITHNKIINVMKNNDDFLNMIYDDLNNNKKIAIASMSSNEVEKINDELKKRYPIKNILIYTGLTSDEDKQALKNMDIIFKDADVILYSPTITAGVSYDVISYNDYFDCIYGVICCGSCSSRDFKQQLNRIRKIKNNVINVLNISPMKNNNNSSFFSFDDIKAELLTQNDITITRQTQILYENNIKKVISKKVIGKYDINYIHNITENKNNGNFYFMHYMELLFVNSGYQFNYIDDKKGKKKDNINFTLDMIVKTETISKNNANEFLEYQQAGKTTKEENLLLKKYFIMSKFGLDNIDYDIIKPLYKNNNIFDNLLKLLDNNIITINDDNYTLKKFIKLENVKKLMDTLGFNELMDTIQYSDFEDKLNNFYDSNDWEKFEYIFNNTKVKITKQRLLTFIKNILKNYGIILSPTKKTELKPVLNKKGNQVISKTTKQPKFKEVKVKGEFETITNDINKIYYELIAIHIKNNKLNFGEYTNDKFIFNDENRYINYIEDKNKCLIEDNEEEKEDNEEIKEEEKESSEGSYYSDYSENIEDDEYLEEVDIVEIEEQRKRQIYICPMNDEEEISNDNIICDDIEILEDDICACNKNNKCIYHQELIKNNINKEEIIRYKQVQRKIKNDKQNKKEQSKIEKELKKINNIDERLVNLVGVEINEIPSTRRYNICNLDNNVELININKNINIKSDIDKTVNMLDDETIRLSWLNAPIF